MAVCGSDLGFLSPHCSEQNVKKLSNMKELLGSTVVVSVRD